MDNITYKELVVRYGTNVANELLVIVENFGKKKNNITALDREERLRLALDALNDNCDSMSGEFL